MLPVSIFDSDNGIPFKSTITDGKSICTKPSSIFSFLVVQAGTHRESISNLLYLLCNKFEVNSFRLKVLDATESVIVTIVFGAKSS